MRRLAIALLAWLVAGCASGGPSSPAAPAPRTIPPVEAGGGGGM